MSHQTLSMLTNLNFQQQYLVEDPYYSTCSDNQSDSCLCQNEELDKFQKNICQEQQFIDYQERVCKQCSDKCQTCYGKEQNNCCSCKDEYYYLETQNECVKCDPSCLECGDDGQCSRCSDNQKIPYQKICICQQNLCLDEQNKCQELAPNIVCNNPDLGGGEFVQHESVLQKFFFNLGLNQIESQLASIYNVISCGEMKYFDYQELQCKECDQSCKSCKSSSKKCIECAEGYYSQTSDECVKCSLGCQNCEFDQNQSQEFCKTCIDGYFLSSQKCQKCDQTCPKCDNNGLCLECLDSQKIPYQNQCICQQKLCLDENNKCYDLNENEPCNNPSAIVCEEGSYFQYEKDKFGCFQCDQNCKACIYSANQCISCETGFYLDSDSNTCKPCHNSCKDCSGPHNNQCKSCEADRNFYTDEKNSFCCIKQCQSCNGEQYNQCLSCPSERQLIKNQCICKKGMCELNEQCVASEEVCKQPDLLICQNNQYFDYDQGQCKQCHEFCQTCRGFTSSGKDCFTCIDGRFIIRSHIGTDQDLCGKCNYTCKTCENSPTYCTSCDINSNRLDYSKEYQTCPCDIESGFYEIPQNQKCGQCHKTCKTCFGESNSNCYTCPDLFIFSNYKCICQDGYYLDSTSKCQKCDYKCQTCNSQNNCLTCPINRILNQVNQDSQCICQDGYFEDIAGQKCGKCDFTCQTCSGQQQDNCLSCPNDRQLDSLNKRCICNNNLFYQDKISRECKRCNYSCKTCQPDSENCLECDENQNRILDNSGICKCKSSYYEDSQLCKPCHYSCQECSGPLASQCISCSSQNNRKQYQIDKMSWCICFDGYYDQYNQQQCSYQCHNTCKTCFGPEMYQCTECKSDQRQLDKGICKCKDGTFNLIQVNVEDQCISCHHSCAKCFGPQKNQCITCKQEENRIKTPSAYTCPCYEGYVDESEDDPTLPESQKKCVQCDHSCKTCQTKKDKCTQCYDPKQYYRYDYSSSYKCPCFKGYFDPGQTLCQQCSKTCDECEISSDNCINCNPDDFRILQNNKCLCKEGYYEILEQDNTPKKQCAKCNYTCKGCVGNSEQCTSCNLSNTNRIDLSNQQKCPCQDGYFDLGQEICSKCDYTCNKCSFKNNCSQCALNSYRIQVDDPNQKGQFLCPCQNGYYDNGSSNPFCAQCLPSCYTCLNNLSCDSCFSSECPADKSDQACNLQNQFRTIVVDQNGVKKCLCKRGYYEDQNTKQCQKCNPECEECSSKDNCINCNTAITHRTVQDQKCECENGYYEITNQINCEKCNPTCVTCSQKDKCSLCDSDVQHRYLDTQSNKCLCETYFFEVNNSPNCQGCDYSCGSCNGAQNNNCLSCDEKDFRQLIDGKCLCLEGYYDEGQKQCKKCHYTCQACSGGSETSCTKCSSQAQRDLKNNNASEFSCPCKSGFYDDGVNSQCKQCYDQNQYCLECIADKPTGGFKCTLCNQPDQRFIDQNGYCKCMDGWYQDGNNRQCLKCSSYCKTCVDKSDKCTSCYENQFRILNQNKGQCVCSQSYYDLETEVCGACHYSCLNCTSNSKFSCTECPGLSSFRSSQINSQGQCLCIDQYYDDGQNKSCVRCDQSCLGCYGPGNSNCNKCNTSNQLQQFYRYGVSCVSECPEGFFKNKQLYTCDQCEKQCRTCKDSKDFCQDCAVYRKEPPKCDCRDGYYESDFQCNSCSPRCSKCTLSESQCTECPSDRLSPPLCECKEGSVEDPVTLKCIQYKMVCPVLENMFELSNSRALWYSQKLAQSIQKNYDKQLVKRRIYPANSIYQVDILVILGVAKFNNLGLYTYSMSDKGQLISVLEQNMDSTTISVQQSISRIVTCDSDIILTVSDGMIKLWIIATNKQYIIIDVQQAAITQEQLFESQSVECFISYEYNLGDVISKYYPTYSSQYSDGTKDKQPNVKILNVIYQQKQTNIVRVLNIRSTSNIFQGVQKSEIIYQSNYLTKFVSFDIDILHINTDAKAVIINDKTNQYIYQRFNNLAFDTNMSNWQLISKKNIQNDLGIDSTWSLIQIYKKDNLIYSNGIEIKSIQLSSLISESQDSPIKVIYSLQVSQDLFNFNQYLQIDDSRAIILVNKQENISSLLYILDIKQNTIITSVAQTDPSTSCKFHLLLQSNLDSSNFVGVSLFLEDDPDQQNQNLANRNKCQSLFQIIKIDSDSKISNKLSNSILLVGGLRSILQKAKFSKFDQQALILSSYYQSNDQSTSTFFISVQEWNVLTNTILRNYQPVQCEDTSKFAMYEVSVDGKIIVCSTQKQLTVQYQQINQDGSVNQQIITPRIVQDYTNIQHLTDTNYVVFYSQTQIEVMDLASQDNSLQLIQDKDLLNLRPLVIKSIQAILDPDDPSQVALMVVISTRLVYFSLQSDPGDKRIIVLDPQSGDNTVDPIFNKFDQIKYVKQYNILVHYFAQYSILNIVRFYIGLKQYSIDSITYDIDSAVETTRVFSDPSNQYTFIGIQDNLKKKVISCNLQYSSAFKCDWTINYYNTYNSLSGFDFNFGIKSVLIWDTNLLNSVTFAYLKSDNLNTKLICTHTNKINNSNFDKESNLISSKSTLSYIMKRLYEYQFSVNYPKEIYFMLDPKNKYDGQFLRWIQYIPVKQIIIQSSGVDTNIDRANNPIIQITESTSILLNAGHISSIQFISVQLTVQAKFGVQIPAITKERYVTSNHNIFYIKDSLNQLNLSFSDSSINIDNSSQSQNQNGKLEVTMNQFFFDGISNLVFNSLVIDNMKAQMQENYSIIRISDVQTLQIINSSFTDIYLSQINLILLENTSSIFTKLKIFNLNLVAINNDITLGNDKTSRLRNIQAIANEDNLLIEDENLIQYFIDSKDQYLIPNVIENINLRKLKTNQNDDSSYLLLKKPSWFVSPIVVSQKTQLQIVEMNATNIDCKDLCFGGLLLNLFSNVTINQSNFVNIHSQLGGALSATNSFQILTVKQSNFDSCKADWVGGSIYLDDSQSEEEGKLYTPQFYLQSVNFTGSSAVQGGAIFQVDSTSMKNIYTKVSNIIFTNNKADYGACFRYQGTSSQSTQQFLANSIFINNKATKNGDKLLSYPEHLVMKMNNSTVYCSDFNSTCVIKDIKSGDKFPGTISFYVASENLEIINLQNLYQKSDEADLINFTVTLVSSDQVDITGKDTANYDPKTNSFLFDELILTSLPNTTQLVAVTTNAIKVIQGEQYSLSYKFNLYLNFRGCLEGEIYQSQALSNLYSCYTCKEGYYSLVQPLKGVTTCLPCPIDGGVICSGGNTIQVSKGYWRSQNILELEYSQCKINPDACIGGFSYGNQLCMNGYVGPQCETCDDSQEFVKSNIFCQLCPGYRLNMAITSLLIFLYLVYSVILVLILVKSQLKKILIRNIHQTMNKFIKQNQKVNKDLYKFIKVEQGDEVSNCIKIILHHFQIIIVIKSFDFYFPTFIEDAISISGSPPDSMIQSFSCLLYPLSSSLGISNAYSKVVAMFLLFIFVNLVMYFFSIKAFRSNSKRQLYFNSTSMLVNLNLFQPTLFLVSIDLLTCRQIINGSYLKGDLRIECNSSIYKKGIFIVIPIMVIMNLILPFYIYYRISYHKKIGQYHQYSYQIGHYKKVTFYWELVKSIMKLLIYTCASVFYDYPTNRAVFIIFVLIVYFLLQNRMSPYRVEMMGKMDNESTIIGWISLLMVILIVENRTQYFTALASFSVLIAVNLAFFILVFSRLIKSSQFYRSFMVRVRLQFTRIKIFKRFIPKKVLRKIYFEYLCQRVQLKMQKQSRASSIAKSLLGFVSAGKQNKQKYVQTQKPQIQSIEMDTTYSQNMKQCLIELEDLQTSQSQNINRVNQSDEAQNNQTVISINETQPQQVIQLQDDLDHDEEQNKKMLRLQKTIDQKQIEDQNQLEAFYDISLSSRIERNNIQIEKPSFEDEEQIYKEEILSFDLFSDKIRVDIEANRKSTASSKSQSFSPLIEDYKNPQNFTQNQVSLDLAKKNTLIIKYNEKTGQDNQQSYDNELSNTRDIQDSNSFQLDEINNSPSQNEIPTALKKQEKKNLKLISSKENEKTDSKSKVKSKKGKDKKSKQDKQERENQQEFQYQTGIIDNDQL